MDDSNEDPDEAFDEPNYYSILNICKDADDEEIKVAYRRMSVMYHPDKHTDPKNKQIAETIFAKVHKAYKVLSNIQSRTIYDIYGQKGLDAGWDVIERRRSPHEIRQEYERLQREAEERRIEQKTNPKGSFSMQLDACDPSSLSIKQMSIDQSIESPLTKSNKAILSGRLNHTTKRGTGMINCAFQRIFSHQMWGVANFGVGTGGEELSLKVSRNLDKKRTLEISQSNRIIPLTLQSDDDDEPLRSYIRQHGLDIMIRSQLTKNTNGFLFATVGTGGLTGKELMSMMTAGFSTSTDRYNFHAQLQLGNPRSAAKLSYTHNVTDDTKLKGILKYGLSDGVTFEYGCEHQMTSLSNLCCTLRIGPSSGVSLVLKLFRHTHIYNVRIILSEVVSPSVVFYGTVAPTLLFLAIKALIVSPMLKQIKEKDVEEMRERHAQLIAEKKREAELALNLMLGSYEQIVEKEQAKHGLIILEAWYGKFISKHRQTDKSTPYVINVRIPIQCLVKESKLLLGDSVKSQITGIYDPCIGEEKVFKIVYEFRDNVHEAIFKDEEAVRIPKQSHKISTKVE